MFSDHSRDIEEVTWKPLRLNEGRTHRYTAGIDAVSVSVGWYNDLVRNEGDRFSRLMRYYEADEHSVEISAALDTIAEDISSCNADDRDILFHEYPDDSKLKKTTVRIIGEMLGLWGKRTGANDQLFNWVRYALKYGIKFFSRNNDGTLRHLPTERFVGYVLSEEDEEKVTHYIYNPKGELIEDKIRGVSKRGAVLGGRQDYKFIPVEDLVIIKVGEGAFGKSIIDRVYRIWRQMTLLEDAVVIYRVVRSSERIVYYIDTGNLQGPKREAILERQRLRLQQKQFSYNHRNGQTRVETEYNPSSMTENIFIPTNANGRGSRVDVLQSGVNLGELGDLKYFANKMAAGLRVPKSLTDVHAEEGQQAQYSDMRVGSIYQTEMRYMGMIKRYKAYIEPVLDREFREFCKERDFIVPEEAVLKITESQSFSFYKEMELHQVSLNLYNATLQVEPLSKKVAMQKYLNFDLEEIRGNEIQKLSEMGLEPDKIKDMPQEHIDNLVYGDKRVAKDYGIQPKEDAGSIGGRRW